MARDFHCGLKIAVYVRTVYVRRVVEPEGVSKCLTVRYLMSPGDCRNAAVHAAAFSHFRHFEPGSGWVGHRRGEETARCLGCLRRLPPEGGVRGSREEAAPCLAARGGEAGARPARPQPAAPPMHRPAGKPLDQTWHGRPSIGVAGVGCREMLNE